MKILKVNVLSNYYCTAALIVIDSNRQRGFADMLPSEIAKSLKLEYDALKCQGKRNDLVQELESILKEKKTLEDSALNADNTEVGGTSAPMEQKLNNSKRTCNDFDVYSANSRRYIRLNYLLPKLLDMVDSGKIAIRPAVDISFLKDVEQQQLLFELENSKFMVDMKKAEKLKEYSVKKKLDEEKILQILSGDFFEKKPKKLKEIKLQYKKITNYIDTSLPPKEVEDFIISALEYYKEHRPS